MEDTLLPGSWSSAAVTEIIDPENPSGSEVDDIIATLPEGAEGKRFIRLKISQ